MSCIIHVTHSGFYFFREINSVHSVSRHFGGTCRVHLQDHRISQQEIYILEDGPHRNYLNQFPLDIEPLILR
jgi:hypothetical protein